MDAPQSSLPGSIPDDSSTDSMKEPVADLVQTGDEAEWQASALREISHDVGNVLHRLFYLTEALRGMVDDDAVEARDTIANLEAQAEQVRGLLDDAMACVAPLGPQRISLALRDVIQSFAQGMGNSDPKLVDPSGVADAEVVVDPALLSRALALICEPLRAVISDPADLELRLSIAERGPSEGGLVRLVVPLPSDAQGRFKKGGGLLVAERYLLVQGGRLEESLLDDHELSMDLPLATPGGKV